MAVERVTHAHPDDLIQDRRTAPQPPSADEMTSPAPGPGTNRRTAFPLEAMDRVSDLAIKATALLSVLSSAAMADDPPTGEATSTACYAIKGMVEEMKGIVSAVFAG